MYQLKKGVYLVRGILNGAILDTNSGNVYSINAQACGVLTGEAPDKSYWQILMEMGVAENVENPIKQELPGLERSPMLDFVWFEVVTDDCNERCIHCYADAMPKSYRKQHANNPSLIPANQLTVLETQSEDYNKKRMAHEDWLKAIAESYALGCRKCQFIGGEPFLYSGPEKETVLDLASFCIETGYEVIEIYTNATLLNPSKVKRIKKLGLKIAVSLYSIDASVHDSITRTPGSHAITMKALKLLKENDVPTRVEVVLMKSNQHTVKQTLEWREKNGFSGKLPDPLRPNGRGDDSLLQPDFEHVVTYGIMIEPDFFTDKKTLAHYRTGHSCLLGKLTLTEFGDVLPCIFSRTHVLGNFLDSGDLRSIVEDKKLQDVWSTTKDSIMVCQDCEYRYVCFDCRPLSEGAASGRADFLNAPYPRCSYNPYTGVWGEGLWKLTEDGTPFYEEMPGSAIKTNRHVAQNRLSPAEPH